jgi:hypothetical protein
LLLHSKLALKQKRAKKPTKIKGATNIEDFNFKTALNRVADLTMPVNANISYNLIPKWVVGEDFLTRFLPYLMIVGDSREQNTWIKDACNFYGIKYELAKENKKNGTNNLKEGDYTFKVIYGSKIYDFTGVVAYERKGSVGELYKNCTGWNKEKKTNDRDRISKEFERFTSKKYKKVVLMLEFGNCLNDLINMEFSYPDKYGVYHKKSVGNVIYSTLMSWHQSNLYNFDILQANTHLELFWLFVQDMYYYFRNEIRKGVKKINANNNKGNKERK